jgi:hypothetical protein
VWLDHGVERFVAKKHAQGEVPRPEPRTPWRHCRLQETPCARRYSIGQQGGRRLGVQGNLNGLDAEVLPRGPAQLSASTALRERQNSQRPAAAVRDQLLKDLDAALAALAAREKHSFRPTTATRALFGRCSRATARQDLYFDQFRAGQSAFDDNNEPDPATIPTNVATGSG